MASHRVEGMEVRASGGDADAKFARGRQLLTEPPLSAEEGIQLVTEAAEAGHGEAMHLLALLDASGQLGAANWSSALERLTRAAELGYTPAASQLALLAGDRPLTEAIAKGEALSKETLERLWQSIDMRRLLELPRARVAFPAPRIAVVEKFLAPELCDWIVARGRPHLRHARIDDPASGEPVYAEGRTNSAAELDLSQTDVVMHLVRARISALCGPPTSAMEGVSILHYQVGQQFFPHFDFFDTALPGYAHQVAEFGQRVMTFLIYLNDGYQGGETSFPVLNWRFKGRKGDGLLFWNVDTSGQPDRRTQHAGTAPTAGEKWLFSQWVRGRVS